MKTDNEGTFCTTFAGFDIIVKDWLTRNGIKFVRAASRHNPRRIDKPQLGRLERWNRPIDAGFLEFLRRSQRGMIRYSGKVHRDWLITQVALAYRKSEIMVTASLRHEVRALAGQIRPYYSKVKPYFVDDYHGPRRLVVTTPAKAHAGKIEIEKRDFYFALDPLGLLQERALSNPLEPLDQAKRARIFGFLPLERELNRREQTLLMGIFGTDELVLYQHGSVARKIEVTAVPANGRPRELSVRDDAMSVRKQAIWRNEARHKLVASLARAVHRTSEVELVKNFPRLAGLQLASRAGDVVVLVDNVEQATEMGKHLKAAKLVLDRNFWGSGLDLAVSQRIHEFETRPKTDFSLLIATMAGLWRVPKIGILIRADSGRGLPPMTGEQLSTD